MDKLFVAAIKEETVGLDYFKFASGYTANDPYNLIDRAPTTSIYDEDLSLLSLLPHQKFTGGDFERDIVQRDDIAIAFGQVANDDISQEPISFTLAFRGAARFCPCRSIEGSTLR